MGFNPNNGIGDAYSKIEGHASADAVTASLRACESGRGLAMVDSRRGITNLHVPSDVIIDASMQVVIRDSGMMWNKDDELETCKSVIPDRCYAGVYAKTIQFCKENGAFDVATMGNVANVRPLLPFPFGFACCFGTACALLSACVWFVVCS